MQKLWYAQPAAAWSEALPIGNGSLGAMLFGGSTHERIALNEDTFWSGHPHDTNRPGAAGAWREARALALSGRLHEAQTLLEAKAQGSYTENYLPVGDLLLDQPGAEEAYTLRGLNLETAVHRTEYRVGGVSFLREAFVSHPGRALFLRLTADRPGAVNVTLRLQSQLEHAIRSKANLLTMDLRAPSHSDPSYHSTADPVVYSDVPAEQGMRCRVQLAVTLTGGSLESDGGALVVRGADALELRLVIRTSFNGFDRSPETDGLDEKALCAADLKTALSRAFDEALAEHIADYQRFWSRVSLVLEGGAYDALPTDERLRRRAADDFALDALLFDFGRYLLIASSRPGSQATNLQGIWNQEVRPPWSSNYTVNINTEMNYWAAQRVALPEMCEPLFSLIDDLCVRGQETARVHYGARGAVSHHNTDLWRLTNPVGEQNKGSAGYAFWPMSLAWLCRSMAEHWRFSGDKAFLRDRALPDARQALRFLLDASVCDEDGYLTIAPATSPENSFYYEGARCNVARRATMTTEIFRELAAFYLEALSALGLDEPMAAEAREALQKLAPLAVGRCGQALEWEREYEECEPHHRHVSHLYGLYPGQRILPGTPDAEACRRSLELRGDDGTGWSLAWKTALWARLGDGDHALRLLHRQLEVVDPNAVTNVTHGGSYISLLCAHPPFQIDGNFGICAAVGEMLVQTRGGELLLGPALPHDWNGSVRGLRAEGGVTVDLSFRAGRVTKAVLRTAGPCAFVVHANGESRRVESDGLKAMEIEM